MTNIKSDKFVIESIENVFNMLQTINDPIERSFLQRLLIKCTQDSNVLSCLQENQSSSLWLNLKLVPTVLKINIILDHYPDNSLLKCLAALAREDDVWVKNFIDGKPMEPFLPEDFFK